MGVVRPITGFHRDEEGHWVAELSCGHGQHTRHDPPLVERPWVQTEEGRASRLGVPLDCPLCDRGEMPEGHRPYKCTKSFTEASVPAALTSNHTTKAGVWALIHVESGELEYSIDGLALEPERLKPGTVGVVRPEVEHKVTPLGAVSFHVEFWRSAE